MMFLLISAAAVMLYVVRDLFIDDTRYSAEISAAAKRHGISELLIRELIRKESRFDAGAVGASGEIGLMQLLPSGAAAEWARVNQQPPPQPRELFSVELNLDIGCWYLARALKRWAKYRCSVELALAEYNAGAKNASRWAPASVEEADVVSRIDFPVTRDYVQGIMRRYQREIGKCK